MTSWKPPRKRLLANSFDELKELVTLPPIESQIRFRTYCNSCDTLNEKGREALLEGDLEKAYIYWMKLCTLWIEKLRRHPGFMKPENLERKQEMQQKVLIVLDELEKVKAKLKDDIYPKYQVWLARQEQLRALYKKKQEEEIARKAAEEQKKAEEKARMKSERSREQFVDLEESDDGVTLEDDSYSQGGTVSRDSMFDSMVTWSTSESESAPTLREITIDQELIYRFLQIVYDDTAKEIESCGLLAGKLQSNGNYHVSHLLLPKQEGTQSTCRSVNEEETGVFQIENDLTPLGWIHTHPTQECFLSSVDLHMQLAHQTVLPEAIAIVCAPRAKPNLGIFWINKNGYQHLKNCKKGCGFHPHLENNLYEVANHVSVLIGTPKYEVRDFR